MNAKRDVRPSWPRQPTIRPRVRQVGAWARIFRDSVAASYTTTEIEALLAPFSDRPLTLGPLVLGDAARAAYVAVAPGGADALPALAEDIAGQLFEAHLGSC